MKKLTYNFSAKVAAVFLWVFMAVGAAWFGVAAIGAHLARFYTVAGERNFFAAMNSLLESNRIDEYDYRLMGQEHAGLFKFVFDMRYASIVLCALCGILFIVLFIFLLCAAGRLEGVEGVHLNFFDRIPLDLYLTAVFFAEAFGISVVGELTYWSWRWDDVVILGLLWTVAAVLMLLIALAFFYTFAARVKAGKWWRNSVIYFALRLCLRWVTAVWRWCLRLVRAVPMVWRIAVACFCFFFFLFVVSFDGLYHGQNATVFFLTACFAFAVCVLGAWQMKALKKAAEELAQGNLDYKVDTRHLYFDYRRHAENLNSIGDGMSAAVEQRMRSERLKTELITNVSHDIKTPLTSIVNYVDLLQKEHTTEQEAEYLAVLARQSDRLRRLTVDLVEASKASTGNLPVELIPTNTEELLHQAVAEYGEKFAAGKLEPVVTMPDAPVSVLADGRHLWRVLDNLFNNAVKYAQPGTRVYIDVRRLDGGAVISVKNISRDRLNVSSEELMERFVRGDTSRHTEGSGLGLSIARSLTELMGGTFDIFIDGDLFKAEIRLKLI